MFDEDGLQNSFSRILYMKFADTFVIFGVKQRWMADYPTTQGP